MSGYVNYFDKNNKYMNVLVLHKKLLIKYNEIWNKVSNLFQKEFDSEPVYNDKYIKTKINLHNNNINTNSYDNKIPEEDVRCVCFYVILLDSIV